MTSKKFGDSLVEYYQGEVLGEAFFESLLAKFSEPAHRYKLASLLQLETETKARLRPAMLELSVTFEEDEQSRKTGRELADAISGGDWPALVSGLYHAGEPLLKRQREIAASAPAAYRELAESMVMHGESIQHFTEREQAGDCTNSIDEVVAQLKFPLPAPR
jgi:hypothetical protein